MKNLFLCLILLCAGSILATAQDASGEKGKAENRTITGCLSQGDSADKFVLTGTDGSKWDLTSDSVSLSKYVGQTVSATGAVQNSTMHNMKEDAKDAAADAGMKKDNTESGDFNVIKLKSISKSCSN